MRELRVTSVESGALLAVGDDGDEYRIPVDAAAQAELRRGRAGGEPAATGRARSESRAEGRRVPPKEIQAHIRAGMSAADVAALTGADLEYVERFEGPVLAEREYVVESALNVPVHTAADHDAREASLFGTVIRERLATGGAAGERWASWKDPEAGWIVKLTFTAESVEHDARWTFEPRTQALSPMNAEAVSISQRGAVPPSLIPRLRAVEHDERPTRFDSDAFTIEEGDLAGPLIPGPLDPGQAVRPAPIPMNQTADLLEALRRRRGERESMVFEPEPVDADEPVESGAPRMRLVEEDSAAELFAGLEEDDDEDDRDDDLGEPVGSVPVGSVPAGRPARAGSTGASAPRRHRASMPSWDEIVFGARSDDDA